MCCILCLTGHETTGTAHLRRFRILSNGKTIVFRTVNAGSSPVMQTNKSERLSRYVVKGA